ncbi:MAG: response regulator [Cyanobacteria bacterium P01_A01_bin.123]
MALVAAMAEAPMPPSESKGRILVIEDDAANLKLLVDYLEHLNYAVLGLEEGRRLLQHLTSFRPHVILLDIKLPGPSGYHLIQQVRQHPLWQRLPIVVLSGYAFATDRQKALDLGANDYLVKPVKLQQLRQRIEQACDLSP